MDKLTCDVVEGAEIYRHESGKIAHIVRRSPAVPAWWVALVLVIGLTLVVGGSLYFTWHFVQWVRP